MTNLQRSIIISALLLLELSPRLHSQSFVLGLTGAGGVLPKTNAVNSSGIFKPRLTQPLIAQGGIYIQVDFASRFFVRVSGQLTGVQYGVKVDFDPAQQPEVPFKTNSVNRFWFNAIQPELRIGYKLPLYQQRSLFLVAGLGTRVSYSTANVYSFVIGLSAGQTLLCYEEILDTNDSRIPIFSIGAEYAITLWRNYSIMAGLEYQYARSAESQVNYEFFPAQTVSYSSGKYSLSPHGFCLRLSVPVLWWKKKDK
jgi:hypothetical protein